MKLIKNQIFLNGILQSSKSNQQISCINPATEETLSEIANCNLSDLNDAIETSKLYNPPPPSKRASILYKLTDLIKRDFNDLALLESLETGKTLKNTQKEDIPGSISVYKYYAGLADKISSQLYSSTPNKLEYSSYEPVGIVGLIYPWNYPSYILAQKVAPAFAAGCSIIIKPAEETSLLALKMATLMNEAGFPKGSLNVLTGYGEGIGKEMIKHKDISMISFTGSTEVGRQIIQQSSIPNIKRLQLELGGKSANIIMNDADISIAVDQAICALFTNYGQICTAGSRLFVQSKIYNEFIDRVIERVKRFKIGDPLQKDTDYGPLISRKHLDKVLNYIDIGVKEGAQLVQGGKQINQKGFYIEPTIFIDATDHMRICTEEIFGPVMTILKFDDIDEVISRANSSQYGLAAGIVTSSQQIAQKLATSLKAGSVFINNYGNGGPGIPVGGMKDSGYGRELGYDGLLSFLEKKVVIQYI